MNTAESGRRDFATRLYEKLASTNAGKSLFLSPFSIRVALAMCSVGAKGETRRVMTDLIGEQESVDDQNRHFAKLLKWIHGEGESPFQLVIANAMWGQKGYHFNGVFRKAIADFYDGAFHEVDFRAKPDDAVSTINRWVGLRTHGKIKELVRRDFLNDDSRLLITNAIYFKGQWEKSFDKADTAAEDWFGSGRAREVPMMHRTGRYSYYETDSFQALDVSYKGRQLSMLVVLPRKKDGLASLEREWAAGGACRQVTEQLEDEKVIVSLPRFKLEAEFKLKPVLCGLFAELPFSDEADFSGIGEEPMKISEVVHKAFVEVNEEGTEAAAATAVGMVLGTGLGSPSLEPKVFRADHPFLFFIRERKTNTLLFSGRVIDPK